MQMAGHDASFTFSPSLKPLPREYVDWDHIGFIFEVSGGPRDFTTCMEDLATNHLCLKTVFQNSCTIFHSYQQ